MSELRECPWLVPSIPVHILRVEQNKSGYRVACICGAVGPISQSFDGAKKEWNIFWEIIPEDV